MKPAPTYTVEEVATALRLPERTIRELAVSRSVTCIYINRENIRFTEAHYQALLKKFERGELATATDRPRVLSRSK